MTVTYDNESSPGAWAEWIDGKPVNLKVMPAPQLQGDAAVFAAFGVSAQEVTQRLSQATQSKCSKRDAERAAIKAKARDMRERMGLPPLAALK